MKAFETMIRMQVGPPEKYGLPKPDHAFGQAHPTASDSIFDRLRHGAITPKPNIARLHCDEVEFVDGSRERVDVVVYGTGYRISFRSSIRASSPRRQPDRAVPRVLHPDIPSVFFVGLVQPLGATMPIAETQGRWIADNLRGDYVPPGAPRCCATRGGG